jgi:hypothetical protein
MRSAQNLANEVPVKPLRRRWSILQVWSSQNGSKVAQSAADISTVPSGPISMTRRDKGLHLPRYADGRSQANPKALGSKPAEIGMFDRVRRLR